MVVLINKINQLVFLVILLLASNTAFSASSNNSKKIKIKDGWSEAYGINKTKVKKAINGSRLICSLG